MIIEIADHILERAGITPEEMMTAVKTTSWSISTEVHTEGDEDGEWQSCHIDVSGSFEFRGDIEFKSTNPDYELEFDDYYGDEKPSTEIVEAICKYVEVVINERLEQQCDSAKEDAYYDANDAAEYAAGSLRYYGLSECDFR